MSRTGETHRGLESTFSLWAKDSPPRVDRAGTHLWIKVDIRCFSIACKGSTAHCSSKDHQEA
jgi:hypothetical protein